MATTAYGSTYVSGTDLVANYPAASLLVAQGIDSAGYFVGRGINAQTASYTTVLTDAGKTVSMTNAGATTLTIPANSSVAFVVGTRINILNLGAGACTATAGAGVTIAGTISALATNASAAVIKTATNTWSYVPFGSAAALLIDYLVVGGGGGGGNSVGVGGAGGSGVVILRYADNYTITIGAGLTGTESAASGGYKRATFTAGSGNVSFA